MPNQVDVANNPEANRYEARIAGGLAGIAEYQLTDELVVFTHTEVDPAFEGQGIGGALAKFALDDVDNQGTRKILVVCPFITSWINHHPEYAHLLYGSRASYVKD